MMGLMAPASASPHLASPAAGGPPAGAQLLTHKADTYGGPAMCHTML